MAVPLGSVTAGKIPTAWSTVGFVRFGRLLRGFGWALVEFSVDDELIDAGSATMVFVTGEKKFPVHPKLPSVF